MPSKRPVADVPLASQKKTDEKNKKTKTVEADSSTDEDENSLTKKKYLLEREKVALHSKIKRIRKELSTLRLAQRESEFNKLQNPDLQQEMFPELSQNVNLWSKYIRITLDNVSYRKGNSSWNWLLEGSVGDIKFVMKISCAVDEETKKGYVSKYIIQGPDHNNFPELNTWFKNNPRNIEQVFKILKAYEVAYKDREAGLEDCQKEFGSLITINRANEFGEITLDLATDDSHYFHIKWTLTTCIKHYSRIKNSCRLSCTEDGKQWIKQNSESFTQLKKQLSQSPVQVIQQLARGILSNQTDK